jgi:peptidoglycan/xylan/chitin deacetylase (PgdA/CDA1 family)
MQFCIRDDDTSFFTTPDDLENAYGEISRWGPISLAIIPFCRAGTSKGVPERFRRRWSVHPLHENQPLVDYLRQRISDGRFEAMIHGYHHDESTGVPEFARGKELRGKVAEGRRYLEDLLGTTVRVFVPPRNSIGSEGLRAIARFGLHLGGTAGMRTGWSVVSPKAWLVWRRLRRWRKSGGVGVPWILDLGDHREIPGNAVTPSSTLQRNEAAFDCALRLGGVFCAATHYWEFHSPSIHGDQPTVGEHLRRLIDCARSHPEVLWRSVGQVISEGKEVV